MKTAALYTACLTFALALTVAAFAVKWWLLG